MLQTGIGFIRLSIGYKNVLWFIRTPVSQTVIGPSAQSGLYQRDTVAAGVSRLHISLYKNVSVVIT